MPPRIRTVSGTSPPFYFGGFSPAAKDTAAQYADVFLTWPDTVAGVRATIGAPNAQTGISAASYDFVPTDVDCDNDRTQLLANAENVSCKLEWILEFIICIYIL